MTEYTPTNQLKRKRSLSSEPSLPLTKANLRLLNSMTDGVPTTPGPVATSTRSRSTMTSNNSQHVKKVKEDTRLLALHNIKEDEKKLAGRPQLKLFVEDIIDSDRWSVTSQKSVDTLEQSYKKRKYDDEGGFLNGVMPLLIKRERAVKKKNASDGKEEIVLEDWDYTILKVAGNYQSFATNSVPLNGRVGGRFTTPRPDFTYGTTLDEVSLNPVIREKIESRMRILERMENPFLIVEAKSMQGLQEAAVIQAMRGGAALVYAMEEIWRSVHDEQYEAPAFDQPQSRSAVFSFIIHPLRATLYINWCQHKRGENGGLLSTKYYMTEVKAWLVGQSDLDTLVSCRRALHNILDWGIGRRHTIFWDMVKTADRRETESAHAVNPGEDN